jgi:hypothetical protein
MIANSHADVVVGNGCQDIGPHGKTCPRAPYWPPTGARAAAPLQLENSEQHTMQQRATKGGRGTPVPRAAPMAFATQRRQPAFSRPHYRTILIIPQVQSTYSRNNCMQSTPGNGLSCEVPPTRLRAPLHSCWVSPFPVPYVLLPATR